MWSAHSVMPLHPTNSNMHAANGRFPEGGKMSQHLDSLNLGDTVDFTGPTGHVK